MSAEHPTEHPNPQALERFLRGDATKPEKGEIVSHLIAGCRHCQEATRALWVQSQGLRGSSAGEEPRVHPSSYGQLWRRVLRAHKVHEELLRADRHQARRLCRELIELPSRERLAQVCQGERFRSFHLAQLLTEESLWRRLAAPQEAVDLAEVALAVAERLERGPFHPSAVRDLKAAAWAALGTGHRRKGDLESAERAFCVADALLREGSGDPLERARLLLLRAALRRDQRRFEEALALLRQAEASHGHLGDEPLLGHIHIERGRIEAWIGDLQDAIESAREGLRLLDPERDARVALDTRVQMGHWLLDLGNTAEAMKELHTVQGAPKEASGEPHPPLELDRLTGRVALARGDYGQAETCFRSLRNRCLDLKAGNEATRATLDLAALYLQQDPEKLRHLGREVEGALFPGMDLDALLSLDFLRWAAEAPHQHAGLIPCLSHHLERCRPSAW